jgi:hypothetical protein
LFKNTGYDLHSKTNIKVIKIGILFSIGKTMGQPTKNSTFESLCDNLISSIEKNSMAKDLFKIIPYLLGNFNNLVCPSNSSYMAADFCLIW